MIRARTDRPIGKFQARPRDLSASCHDWRREEFQRWERRSSREHNVSSIGSNWIRKRKRTPKVCACYTTQRDVTADKATDERSLLRLPLFRMATRDNRYGEQVLFTTEPAKVSEPLVQANIS